MRRLLLALAVLFAPLGAMAQNQLPSIQGPGGYQTAAPTVQIGYDSGTGAPCVVGKTATCVLSVGVVGSVGGALSVYGPDAVNVAPTKPPVLGGCYSTTSGAGAVSVNRVQYNACDLSGRMVTVGAAANGSPALGYPVLSAGSDGTNARTLSTTAAGALNVVAGASESHIGEVGGNYLSGYIQRVQILGDTSDGQLQQLTVN